jgi:hypothetical protein
MDSLVETPFLRKARIFIGKFKVLAAHLAEKSPTICKYEAPSPPLQYFKKE